MTLARRWRLPFSFPFCMYTRPSVTVIPFAARASTTSFAGARCAPYRSDARPIGRLERLRKVITGMETDDFGTIRVLDAAAWQERRQRLQKLGGPPTQ
jgi:hypothetical protein